MKSIGEFSRLGGVSVRTLRYYDRIGLLCPAEVDSETGYRWYLPSQLPDLTKIIALRQLGLSLAEIRDLVAASRRGRMRARLTRHRSSLAKRAEDDQRRLSQLDAALEAFGAERPILDDVVVKRSLRDAACRNLPACPSDSARPTWHPCCGKRSPTSCASSASTIEPVRARVLVLFRHRRQRASRSRSNIGRPSRDRTARAPRALGCPGRFRGRRRRSIGPSRRDLSECLPPPRSLGSSKWLRTYRDGSRPPDSCGPRDRGGRLRMPPPAEASWLIRQVIREPRRAAPAQR